MSPQVTEVIIDDQIPKINRLRMSISLKPVEENIISMVTVSGGWDYFSFDFAKGRTVKLLFTKTAELADGNFNPRIKTFLDLDKRLTVLFDFGFESLFFIFQFGFLIGQEFNSFLHPPEQCFLFGRQLSLEQNFLSGELEDAFL